MGWERLHYGQLCWHDFDLYPARTLAVKEAVLECKKALDYDTAFEISPGVLMSAKGIFIESMGLPVEEDMTDPYEDPFTPLDLFHCFLFLTTASLGKMDFRAKVPETDPSRSVLYALYPGERHYHALMPGNDAFLARDRLQGLTLNGRPV